MYITLARGLSEKLSTLPETGMGYQTVDLLLEGGAVVPDVMVFNGQLAELPPKFAHLRAEQIVDIRLTLSG